MSSNDTGDVLHEWNSVGWTRNTNATSHLELVPLSAQSTVLPNAWTIQIVLEYHSICVKARRSSDHAYYSSKVGLLYWRTPLRSILMKLHHRFIPRTQYRGSGIVTKFQCLKVPAFAWPLIRDMRKVFFFSRRICQLQTVEHSKPTGRKALVYLAMRHALSARNETAVTYTLQSGFLLAFLYLIMRCHIFTVNVFLCKLANLWHYEQTNRRSA